MGVVVVLGGEVFRPVFDAADQVAHTVEKRRSWTLSRRGLWQCDLNLHAIGNHHIGRQRDRMVVDFRGDRHWPPKMHADTESRNNQIRRRLRFEHEAAMRPVLGHVTLSVRLVAV